MYTCPICGYNRLEHPARDFNICPCCYTEFGYEDHITSPAELRAEWIRNGMRWEGSNVIPAPADWSPIQQLIQAGYLHDLYMPTPDQTEIVVFRRGPHSFSSGPDDRRLDTVSTGSRVRLAASIAA